MIVDLIIPVFNEEAQLASSVRALLGAKICGWPKQIQITICDNGSTDDTQNIGEALAEEDARVRYLRLEQKGRGGALRAAWMRSTADIVAYMDVDLSTELDAFPKALQLLSAGATDIVIGNRYDPESRIVRGAKRSFLSLSYYWLAHHMTGTRISDLQCGFKAMSRMVARKLIPMVQANGWFFDTELLLIAEHLKMRVHELPISWVDDNDSRVSICPTIYEDCKGLLRMRSWLRAQDSSVF